MLAITIIDDETGNYEAVVYDNDTLLWRGRVTKRDDWKKQALELVQAAYRLPLGDKR